MSEAWQPPVRMYTHNDAASIWTPPADAKCKVCGCTEQDCTQCIARTGRACTWAAEDLCSACVEPHTFDPHPLRPLSCAVCSATFIPGDPVCHSSEMVKEATP